MQVAILAHLPPQQHSAGSSTALTRVGERGEGMERGRESELLSCYGCSDPHQEARLALVTANMVRSGSVPPALAREVLWEAMQGSMQGSAPMARALAKVSGTGAAAV